MRTLQEIFDIAYLGLAKQGFQRSMGLTRSNFVTCAYRGEDGRKCAIGHLIPDDSYDASLEGEGVCGHYVMKAAGLAGAENSFVSTLARLQDCHDDSKNPDAMREALADFAEAHSLTIPSIGEQV